MSTKQEHHLQMLLLPKYTTNKKIYVQDIASLSLAVVKRERCIVGYLSFLWRKPVKSKHGNAADCWALLPYDGELILLLLLGPYQEWGNTRIKQYYENKFMIWRDTKISVITGKIFLSVALILFVFPCDKLVGFTTWISLSSILNSHSGTTIFFS